MLVHADYLEQQLERHGPGEAMVRLSLTGHVFLRSDTWARWQLGIPLRTDGWGRGGIPQAKKVYTAPQQNPNRRWRLRRPGVWPPPPLLIGKDGAHGRLPV